MTAAVVCSWLATKLLRPVEDLRKQTRSFAEGDLGARTTGGLARGLSEIEALAQDFDYMAERIKGLVRSQQQLLHYVSHGRRTSLTGLQLAIGIADDREDQRLNELLNEILNYSKLEAAEFLPRQLVDCRDFIESIAGDASFEAQAAGKQVVVRGSEGGRYAGDRELLRSALENVIRNAIRHSPPGGTVEVEQRELAGGGWEVLIDDRGPGVAAADLQRMFEPFYRASGGMGDGYGLGLAIARRVAMLHGGRVEARAREGQGLSVVFQFPGVES